MNSSDAMQQPWAVGQVVNVAARTWPGINRPGGCGTIVKIHLNQSGTVSSLDVKYILHGGSDTDLPLDCVQPMDNVLSSGRPKRTVGLSAAETADIERKHSRTKPKTKKNNNESKNHSLKLDEHNKSNKKPNNTKTITDVGKTSVHSKLKQMPNLVTLEQKCVNNKKAAKKNSTIKIQNELPRENKKAKMIVLHADAGVKSATANTLNVPKEIILHCCDALKLETIEFCSPITAEHTYSNNSHINESDSLDQESYDDSFGESNQHRQYAVSLDKENRISNVTQALISAVGNNQDDKKMNSRIALTQNAVSNTQQRKHDVVQEPHQMQAQNVDALKCRTADANSGLEVRKLHLTLREVNHRVTSDARAFVEDVTGVTAEKKLMSRKDELLVVASKVDQNVIGLEEQRHEKRLCQFNTIFSALLGCKEGVLDENVIQEEMKLYQSRRHKREDWIDFTPDEVETFLTILVNENKIHRFEGTVYKI